MALTISGYDRCRQKLIAGYCVGRTVLDIGYAQSPNQFLDQSETTGLDLTVNRECKYNKQVLGDAKDIGELFKGCRFDTVIAAEFIEHIPRPYEFLDSLRVLIDHNGRLILSTPNPVGFPAVLAEWMRLKTHFYTLDHLYYFSPRWVERMLNRTGYKLDSIKGIGPWPVAIPRYFPASLSYQVIYVASLR